MENQRKIKGFFDHIFTELEVPNIENSIKKADFEQLQNTHNSIHEFIYLAPLCVPSGQEISWYPKSAFLIYCLEAFYSAHRSLLEALSGYYNVSYTLLRNTLELLLRGAFWECLAHKSFRDKADIIKRNTVKVNEKTKMTLIDWFDYIFKIGPTIEEEFEKVSASIFDKISPIPKDRELRKLIPFPKEIIEQLSEWGIFTPVPANMVYGVYIDLSADAHVIPDKTDTGRRLIKEEELFETTIIPGELNKFCGVLHKVMDIGVVIELSILSNWIEQSESVKNKLKERLPIIERDLQLPYASLKIRDLVK